MLGSIEFNSESLGLSTFYKQLIYFGLGLIILFSFSFLDYRWLRNYAYVLYIVSAILLILVLIFGATIRGTTGWFKIGPASFQPVELVKIFLIIFLAYFFSQYGEQLFQLKKILISGLFAGGLILLVILQPDLGSALIFLAIWLGLLFLVRTKKRYLVLIIGSLALVMVASFFLVLKDYQQERILTFMDPGRDPLGTGYNLSQSLIAVGSGQFWGRGLGLGTQSQLNFLPEQENDFIFAAISEELGFFGAGLILLLFTILFYRLFKMIRKSNDDFAYFVVCGFLIYLFVQLFINVGMNMGIMPITGLPLPFVSAGGSSLLTLFLALAIIQSIYIKQKS